jgi:hypothetical protein
MKRHFEVSILDLASFQSGVGEQPIYQHGLSPNLLKSATSVSADDAASIIAQANVRSPKNQEIFRRKDAESKELMQLIHAG